MELVLKRRVYFAAGGGPAICMRPELFEKQKHKRALIRASALSLHLFASPTRPDTSVKSPSAVRRLIIVTSVNGGCQTISLSS
jgi:hypothetical protein